MYTFMWCQIVSHAEQQPRVLDESHRSSSTFCTFKCVRQFSTKYSRTPFPLKPVFYGDLALNFSRKHLSFPLSNFLLPSAKVWALKVQHHVFNFPAHLSTCRVLERRQMQFFLTVSSICRFPQGLLWCTRSRLVLIGNPFFMKTANDLDFFFFFQLRHTLPETEGKMTFNLDSPSINVLQIPWTWEAGPAAASAGVPPGSHTYGEGGSLPL